MSPTSSQRESSIEKLNNELKNLNLKQVNSAEYTSHSSLRNNIKINNNNKQNIFNDQKSQLDAASRPEAHVIGLESPHQNADDSQSTLDNEQYYSDDENYFRLVHI